MKMTPAHYESLRTAIEPLDTADRREAYRTGDFPRAEEVTDLNVRYRWDLFWAVTGFELLPRDVHGCIYNSDHIDTALRKIIPAL